MSTLQERINEKSKTIQVDKYPMSIGEIINLYNDGELDIHPEFQRFFRWTELQKTRLIESLLLNIPIPPIFVSQRIDGVWDVVDGLQRISTILNFAGVYKDNNGEIIPPLILQGTDLLPELADKQYDNKVDDSKSFSIEEKRYFKRARLDIIILQKESDTSSKYELFQRLNTGGTSLSDQEVRNCLMVMISPDKYKIFEEMSKCEYFTNMLRISDDAIAERYDLELVTRFVCLRRLRLEDINKVTDIGKYLSDRIIELFDNEDFDIVAEKEIFEKTFQIIYNVLGDSAFCKYDIASELFRGRFLVSAFEIVALGLGAKNGVIPENFDLKQRVIDIWKHIDREDIRWTGYSASGRLQKTLKLGLKLYNEED